MSPGSLPEVFIDTDVAFDIISKRMPHFEESVEILKHLINGQVTLLISESCIANLIYLSFDIHKIEDARARLIDFIATSHVISCGKRGIIEALQSQFKDKEDAVQYYTALTHGADYFITRNTKDYKHAVDSLPVMTPRQFGSFI